MRSTRGPGERADRGTVTAELAIGLPSVVMLLGLLTGVGAVARAQLQCVDAASAAARQAARGESDARVAEVARRTGPQGAGVSVSGGTDVTVVVSASVSLPIPGTPALEVRGSATTSREQG